MLINQRNVWLFRFALFTVFSTLCLICIGGVVTSTESGMTVPDWPNSYGYNMFLFPISLWEGGIFYEHTHRLVASFVGFITIILAVWLQISKSVDGLTKKLGWFALGLVIFQGVLGGLRVELVKDWIGIFHAIIAQCFLALLAVISFRTSSHFQKLEPVAEKAMPTRAFQGFAIISCLILVQLAFGATMRHQHQGLAVPDFPTAYGKIWPDISDAKLAEINELRSFNDEPELSKLHIVAHMMHRFLAYGILIFATLFVIVGSTLKWFQNSGISLKYPISWCLLIWGQGLLGIVTVMRNKPADIATAHVLVGSVSLVAAVILTKQCYLRLKKGQKAALTSPHHFPQTAANKEQDTISSAA